MAGFDQQVYPMAILHRGAVLLMVSSLLWAAGCNDRSEDLPDPYFFGESSPAPEHTDAGGDVDPGIDDEPVEDFCLPGAQRCLAENSPIYEICRASGQSFERRACDSGEVCRDRRCVPFACTPGREICMGTSTQATCDATGRNVTERRDCEGEEVCLGGRCSDLCSLAQASSSYIGCHYVAESLPNFYQFSGDSGKNSPFAIVLANPHELLDATVTIRDRTGAIADLRKNVSLTGPNVSTTITSAVLRPDGTQEVIDTSDNAQIPPESAAVFLMQNAEQRGPFEISATRPVVAYQFSPYCCNFTYTNDASLLLPTATLKKRYRVLGYPMMPASSARPYVRVHALEDSEITIDSPIPVRAGATDVEAETPTTVDLAAGQVLQLTPVQETANRREEDLSGVEIESTGRVAAFTGHPCTLIPQDEMACDHLEEQLLPAEILGRKYILVPTRQRTRDPDEVNEATYWRIVADEDARVTFSPDFDDIRHLRPPSNNATSDCATLLEDGIVALEEGEVCEFGTLEPVSVSSTGKLIIGGAVSGQASTGAGGYGRHAGDPSLFILPPKEQFRRDYSFVAPPTYEKNYVAVAARAGAAVTLDGRNIPLSARLERREVELAGERWEVFNVAIVDGVHRMSSTDRFGIVVYAYDDYVSYAFTGGLDLLPKGVSR